MHLSRFVLVYRDAAPGEHVLYDVIADQYAGVDGPTLDALERWRREAPADAREADAERALAELGFLVEDDADDEARLAGYLARARQGMPGTLYVTLMPTLACNLACSYCFQKDHPATGRMGAETEDAAIRWILAKVDETGARRLLVHFIGGEPLTRKDLLLRSSGALAQAMEQRGGEFAWELTTNAVGLEPAFVDALLAFGRGTVKVTLDGDRETHDLVRVRRNGSGTFDEVFAATAAVGRECPGVKLRIGGNFAPGQAGSYERLLERLEAAGLAGRIDEIRFKPVVDCEDGAPSCGSSCGAVAGEGDALVQIGRAVERKGLARTPASLVDAAGPCELHWSTSFIIDPAGRVYKCLAVAGRPEMAVGTVHDAALREAPLLAAEPWRKHLPCHTCAFLPVCMGGCLGARFLQTGRAGEVLCRQELYEKAFREEITRRYLAEFHDGAVPQAA